MTTMNDVYGDGSNHIRCPDCGYCVTCGDCDKYGCGCKENDEKDSPMKTHELKTDPDVFQALKKGLKTFEIRKDDRGFQVGDDLLLRETYYTGEEMKNGKPLRYTGREQLFVVNYILRGPCYGLQEGWVIMS